MSENYVPKSAVGKWFNDRLPLLNLIYGHLLPYPTPKNLNYWWTFGGILTFCLVTQIITGLVLSISGTVIIQTVDITRSDYFIGNSLSLLSSFFMALVWIQAKKVRKSLGTITYSRNLFLIAAITILFIVVFRLISFLF